MSTDQIRGKTAHIYTVSEITRNVKAVLEEHFYGLWVEGEVSNLRIPSSGHMYFTLKDKDAQLQAVMYRHERLSLKFSPKDGLKVLAYGPITVYEKSGRYQLNVKTIEPRGVGALQLAFEELKRRLAEEGLFAPRVKKPIPLLPERIGVVTSPTGAAIRDILNVIERRFSDVHIIIYPVTVQGELAAGEIAHAIDELNRLNLVDVMIVGRGGGSLEDLWAFNQEIVARSIFQSKIPVISAVGHEIDWTIADFVADLRVPTPSAAAELVVARKSELHDKLNMLQTRLSNSLVTMVKDYRSRLTWALENRFFLDPTAIIREYEQQIDDLESLLHYKTGYRVKLARQLFETRIATLDALSPLSVLDRGYSFTVRRKNQSVVRDAGILETGEEVITKVSKGEFISCVKETR